MKKNEMFTELSIQIATLQATVDKVLELLMKPEPYQDEVVIECTIDSVDYPSPKSFAKPVSFEDWDEQFK